MIGYRFYLEYPNEKEKRKGRVKKPGNHSGNVIAVLLHDNNHPFVFWDDSITTSGSVACFEAVAGLLSGANSPVCSASVSVPYLRARCKRIPEWLAREVHPNLFEYLEA